MVAFYVYEETKITFDTEAALDWNILSQDNDGDFVGRQAQPSVAAGRSTRTLKPGVYGVYSNQRLKYSVEGKCVVRTKLGKDDWPDPPPAPPLAFQQVDTQKWQAHAGTFLKRAGESTGFVPPRLVHTLEITEFGPGRIEGRTSGETERRIAASLALADRGVRVLLIGADERQPVAGSPTEATLAAPGHAIATMQTLIKDRLPGNTPKVLQGASATRGEVISELGKLVRNVDDGELLVVLYSGHARQTVNASNVTSEAWELYDGPFGDKELAAALGDVANKAELVLIVDSCYAAGFVEPETKPPADRVIDNLKSCLVLPSSPAPLPGGPMNGLVIAAACSTEEEILLRDESAFASELRTAICGIRTYEEVAEELRRLNTSNQSHRLLQVFPPDRILAPALSPFRR
jgi:hypothetical protein